MCLTCFCPFIGPSLVGFAVVVVVVVVVVVALLLFLRFPVLVLVAPFSVITVLVAVVLPLCEGHCHTLVHGCVVTSSLPACKCCKIHNAE